MESELKREYQSFFDSLDIDYETGCTSKFNQIKFQTYPYIGTKYGSRKKILFIGLDIGMDETPNIQLCEDRRQDIEFACPSLANPHIAGTYTTALYFLKDKEASWNAHWNTIKNSSTSQRALREYELPQKNPLSYVALTNYYKFVDKQRVHRSGGRNRKYLDKEREQNLFLSEIRILNPDMVIFQSRQFWYKKDLLNKLSSIGMPIKIGPHPSYRGKKEPHYFVNLIQDYYYS